MFTTPTVGPKLPIKQRLARNETPVKPFKKKKKVAAANAPLMQAILLKKGAPVPPPY